MRWVKRYKKDGNVDIHYRKPVAYKVKKEYVDFLLQELKKNKTITIEDLLYLLKNKYPDVDLNKSHINRIIKDNNITLKITRIRHELVKRFGKDIDINANINKLIILDNASSHRNERIKELVNKHNNILYAVPYQHFTNSIENYFSMLKSRLQKLDGLTHIKLKENIENVISKIPKEKYRNIFKGAYERPEKYVSNKKTRKIKKNYL